MVMRIDKKKETTAAISNWLRVQSFHDSTTKPDQQKKSPCPADKRVDKEYGKGNNRPKKQDEGKKNNPPSFMLPYAKKKKTITRNVSPEKKTLPRFSLSTVYGPENSHPPNPDTVQIQNEIRNEIHDFFLTKRPIQDIFHITLTHKKRN